MTKGMDNAISCRNEITRSVLISLSNVIKRSVTNWRTTGDKKCIYNGIAVQDLHQY